MTEQTIAQAQMTMQWWEVTVPQAERWLRSNTRNRHESPHRIRRYANDMVEGRWYPHHQALAFDEEGYLEDGQNRLRALIRAAGMLNDPDFSLGFWVCSNTPREAFYVMDTGKPRSLADALTIEGEANARHLSAFTNILWRITDGIDEKGFPAPANPGTARALEFWEPRKHGLREAVPPTNHVYYYLHGPSSAYGGLYYRFAEIDHDDATLFYDKLAVGTHMAKDDPILMLRNHILNYTRAESMHHLDRIHIAGLMVKAWNAYRQGKSVRQLSWKRGGSNPQPFPQPV